MAYEQSRKDDLIAIAYVLIYFANGGSLPWMDCENKKDEVKMKKSLPLEKVLHNTIECISEFYHEVMKLSFDQRPKYGQLKQIFLQ